MNNFKSKDGITIVEVREELAKQKATIQRDKAYTCRRWIIESKGNKYFIRYTPTMGEMLNELKTKKVEGFCKEHEASSDGKTAKVRKEKKEKNKTVKTLRKEKKINTPQIQELQEKHIDLVLKRMRIGISKEEKLSLKEQLVEIRDEITRLGGSFDIGSTNQNRRTDLSKEDLAEARKMGLAKAAAKKEKKNAGKNKTAVLKPNPVAKKKKAKDISDLFDDEIDDDDFIIEEKSAKKVAKPATKKPAKKVVKAKGKK